MIDTTDFEASMDALKGEEQVINESIEEVIKKPMTDTFNKFQVSKMFGDGYQVVIRTSTYRELLDAMKEVKPLIEQMSQKPVQRASTPQNDVYVRQMMQQENCPKCGAQMAVSKLGKPYCSAKCWLQNQM